jgi:hypothetical protein
MWRSWGNWKSLTENEPLTRIRLADGVSLPNLCSQKSRAIIAEDRIAEVKLEVILCEQTKTRGNFQSLRR